LGFFLTRHPEFTDKIEAKEALSAVSKYKFFNKIIEFNILDELTPAYFVSPDDAEYKYLQSRGWTEEMILLYQPMRSDAPHLKHRVIIPVVSNETMVYFSSRDITNTLSQKYYNPSIDKTDVIFTSRLPENSLFSSSAIVCEGIFDCAKLPNGVSLLGKIITSSQQNALFRYLKPFSDIYICLDFGAETNIASVAQQIKNWFPNKRIHTINTTAYGNEDLGSLSEKLSVFDLVSFIKDNSSEYTIPSSSISILKNKLFGLSHAI